MKLVGHDPIKLDLTQTEAVILAYVSLDMFARSANAPCAPAHWFLAAAENVSDKKILTAYAGPKSGAKKFVKATRRMFRKLSRCPKSEAGFTPAGIALWVKEALSTPYLAPESVNVIYALGLLVNGKVWADA